MTETFLPGLIPFTATSTEEKLQLIKERYPSFNLSDVFVWHQNLSDSIAKNNFFLSFFKQPLLFIRINGAVKPIIDHLRGAGVEVVEVMPNVLGLPNGIRLEEFIDDPSAYQIQDLSSHKTGTYFKPEKYDYWWDCCAASGGKSLLLHYIEPDLSLLVSDIRESSLQNLDERFRIGGIKKYHKKVIDLLQNNEQILHHYSFDGILLDAPCSGSGTWGRTPEMLRYFEPHKIENYAKLQKALAARVVPYLKSGKPLIYMTCSVFKAENEDVVHYISENLPLKLEKMELIKGYDEQADNMFVARFIKT
ncbi:Ribosomal RNA small subunit methyltransferase B [compost metagenome]